MEKQKLDIVAKGLLDQDLLEGGYLQQAKEKRSDQQCLRSDPNVVEPERFHQRSESAKSDRLDGEHTAPVLERSKEIGNQTHVRKT